MTTREIGQIAAQWERELPGLELRPFLVSSMLLRLAARIEQAFTIRCRDRGLGPGDMRVLLALRRSGPAYALSPTALYQELMITSGAVSKQVDRLVALGLVERVADPGVPRGVLIQLKNPGRDIAGDMMQEVCTSFAGLEGMPAGTADEVLRALATVQAVLDTAPVAAGAAS